MKKFAVLANLFVFLLVAVAVPAAENQVVAGAGPSTKTAMLFFSHLARHPAAADYNFIVMETSVKHAGGIKNSDSYVFGRTGRPLNAEEKALGKGEIFLAKVPIAFARGLEVGVETLTPEQIEAIYSRKVTNWSGVGGADAPIVLVGREPTEALFSVLKEEWPVFRAITFDRIFKKDHEVTKFLASPAGRHAIAFAARPNLSEPNLLEVEGFDAGVKLGLVYDLQNEQHPLVEAAREAAAGPEWQVMVETTEMRPL